MISTGMDHGDSEDCLQSVGDECIGVHVPGEGPYQIAADDGSRGPTANKKVINFPVDHLFTILSLPNELARARELAGESEHLLIINHHHSFYELVSLKCLPAIRMTRNEWRRHWRPPIFPRVK